MKYEPNYPLVEEADQEVAETQAAIASATKEQYVNQTTDRDPTFELMRRRRENAGRSGFSASHCGRDRTKHSQTADANGGLGSKGVETGGLDARG